jgi:poly-gamma-glutamate capsule biosynthesis protein CapA/YwtB (metallophosphatase superfamily)
MSNTVKILITGDFVPVLTSKELDDEKLVDYLYDKELLKELQDADLSITNLEIPLTNSSTPIKKSGPNLCAPPENIEFIKKGGFKLAAMANNHIMDYDKEGLKDTLELCEKNSIDTFGAGLSEEAAKKTYYTELKGKKIAIINVGENEFLFSKTSEAQVHNFDLIDVYNKIQYARSVADFIILIYHGGVEHYQLPYPRMKKNMEFLAKAGANTIVCHHTHCYSGYEFIGSTPVFYGLGNFFFERKTKRKTWFEGFVLKLMINDTLKVEFEMLPYTQSINESGVRLMDGDKKKEFKSRIDDLNGIIGDTKKFNKAWEELVTSITPKLVKHIYPVGFLSNEEKNLKKHRGTRKVKYLLNLIRAEASYSCLLKALDNIY